MKPLIHELINKWKNIDTSERFGQWLYRTHNFVGLTEDELTKLFYGDNKIAVELFNKSEKCEPNPF